MESDDLQPNQTLNLRTKPNSNNSQTSAQNPNEPPDFRFTPVSSSQDPAVNQLQPEQTESSPTINQYEGEVVPKALVVYFSHAGENEKVGVIQEGNTKIIARNIAIYLKTHGFGVDMFELIPNHPYSASYQETFARAKTEQADHSTLDYVGEINNFYQYPYLFIGYPIWHEDMPMLVYDFLETYNSVCKNKVIIPFCTHERSGDAGTFTKFAQLTNASEVTEGLAVTGQSARTAESHPKIREWLEKLGF